MEPPRRASQGPGRAKCLRTTATTKVTQLASSIILRHLHYCTLYIIHACTGTMKHQRSQLWFAKPKNNVAVLTPQFIWATNTVLPAVNLPSANVTPGTLASQPSRKAKIVTEVPEECAEVGAVPSHELPLPPVDALCRTARAQFPARLFQLDSLVFWASPHARPWGTSVR